MIRVLILDLDNTLYPASATMEADIIRRMTSYASRVTGLTVEEAWDMRKVRMPLYGTTLEWLMTEYGFTDTDDYFAAVHPDGEEAALAPDPELGPLLDSIDLPKYVFTNAPVEHADRVLAHLGVADRFRRVFDIKWNKLRGKPHAEAVDRVLKAVASDTGARPADILFADDVPSYVRGFVARGGAGVLVDLDGRHGDSGLTTIASLAELPAILASA
ncbi:MAG TPA: pyrimidine 5'-nucleotidase [Spirochaetales bacterium]|nr:pyrimidine 5'-nucleotidase [Spirochaetales bacterium]